MAELVLDKCLALGPEYMGPDAKSYADFNFEVLDDTFSNWHSNDNPGTGMGCCVERIISRL